MAPGNQPMRSPIDLTIVMTSMVPRPVSDLRYWASIIDALEDVGFRVHVLTVRAWRLLRPWDSQYVGRYQRNPVVVSPRLVWELFRSRPDYVLALEYGMPTVCAILGAWLGRARLLIFQEHRHPRTVTLSSRRRRYRQSVAHMAHRIIANTQAAEEEVLTELEVPRRKVALITLLSPPSVEAMTREKITLGPTSVRPLFLFVGQLIERKNVDTLLRAAQLLKDRDLEFAVWIVGDGPLRGRLQEMTQALDVEVAVRFREPVPYESIGHIYAASDVFVMPSHVDYRSVAVLEAMRFGKPIIVSQSDGNAGDVVRSGFNGYVFDPRKAEELADCMAAFITNPDLRKRMGAKSRRLMEEQTPARAARQLCVLLDAGCRR